jgi:hypothetical protein
MNIIRLGFLLSLPLLAFSDAINTDGIFNVNILSRGDDNSVGPVDLGFTVSIGGVDYSRVYVNNNGNLTFNGALRSYVPHAISAGSYGPILAPFFTDVDTRNMATSPVTYGSGQIGGRNVFGVNYDNVGEYPAGAILNSFQAIITDRGDISFGDFDIQYNFNNLRWGGRVVSGFWISPSSQFTLGGSLEHGAFRDGAAHSLVAGSLDSSIPGQYNFQVRGGTAVAVVPEPSVWRLMVVSFGVLVVSRFFPAGRPSPRPELVQFALPDGQ